MGRVSELLAAPWAPPLSVIIAEQFTPEERQYFEQVVRRVVESADAVTTTRMTYLTAVRARRHIPRGLTDSAILGTGPR